MEIQWFGHAAFRIGTKGKNILIDPWFTGNPSCPSDAEAGLDKVDFIALTHAHGDHLGDTIRLAKKHESRVIAIAELGRWLDKQGVGNVMRMNMGGTVTFDGISFTMVNALHSSSIDDDGVPVSMGSCAGFVISAGGEAVYHAGDTDIFSDMALIQRIHKPTVGLIPMGGCFTMDARVAAMACNELLDLEVVVPMHYGSFPVVAPNADEFKSLVTRGRVEVIEPGGTLKL
jgi:L-ascorbate metabolism protein UlaG (beta-lactamase superfamily)